LRRSDDIPGIVEKAVKWPISRDLSYGDLKEESRMSQSAIQSILEQIQQLPPEDRILLERELAEMSELEWKREAVEARRLARARNLDQAAIDKAIENVRYPK
jgi:hypothetical protein